MSTSPEMVEGAVKQARGLSSLDRILIGTVLFLTAVAAFLLIASISFQYANYSHVITGQLSGSGPKDYTLVLTFLRALDFATVKTSAVFLGFLLTLTGALYVLRAGEVAFSLGVAADRAHASLQTASPGLVLVVMGAVVLLFALSSRSLVTYDGPAIKSGVDETTGGISQPVGREAPVGAARENATRDSSAPQRPRSAGTLAPLVPDNGPIGHESTGPESDAAALSHVRFRPGASELSEAERRILDTLVARLAKESNLFVDIEGEADTGTPAEFESVLADRRVETIRKFLVEHGIAPNRVRTVSYGEKRPRVKPNGGGATLRLRAPAG